MLRRTFLGVVATASASAMAMFSNQVKFHRNIVETNVPRPKFGPEFTTLKKGKDSYVVPLLHTSEEKFEKHIIDIHLAAQKEYPDTKEFWTYTILNSDGRVGFITSNLELKQA
jgi:hypothetical protein